jgi:hypothetical protein
MFVRYSFNTCLYCWKWDHPIEGGIVTWFIDELCSVSVVLVICNPMFLKTGVQISLYLREPKCSYNSFRNWLKWVRPNERYMKIIFTKQQMIRWWESVKTATPDAFLCGQWEHLYTDILESFRSQFSDHRSVILFYVVSILYYRRLNWK